MKPKAFFFLLLFVAFLSTPTVVKLIEKKADVSQFYSFSEEEDDVLCFHVFSVDGKDVITLPYCLTVLDEVPLHFELHTIRHDNVAEEIFLPPPEQQEYYT